MRPFSLVRSVLALAAAATLLAGCSTSFAPGPETPVQTELGPVGGLVYGGQAPITGAQIYAYQTSTIAYGGASKSLIAATGGVAGYPPTADGNGNYYIATDANGAFEISAATTCTSGAVVYLYSLGGNAGGGTNPNASEMAVLGTCPASGVLINALTAGTSVRIYMNEVSTVAAAYALAGFATDSTDIGAPTTKTVGGPVTDTLAQTGIQNAGANAAQLYTAVATSLTTPGASRAANATTPNGNGTVPQATIDTIANILAACINSASPFSACSMLFNDDQSQGGTKGTKTTDTATAAIYLAQHPYSYQREALFDLVGSQPPFTPDLATYPNDYSITISFTGGGLAPTGGESPHDVAIDIDGNVWSLTSGGVLCEFSPLGVPATSTGYTGNGLDGTASLAIDAASQYIFITNYYTSSVSRFTTGGATAGSFPIGASGQQDANIDGSGDVWVTTDTPNDLIKLSSSGSVLGTYTGNSLATPYGTAIEPGTAGNVWVANEASNDISVFTNSGGVYSTSPFVASTKHEGIGAAVDSSGNVWIGNTDGDVTAFTSAGVQLSGSPFSTGGNFADGVTIDGADNIWVSGYTAGDVYELNDSGTELSETKGFVVSPAADPDGIAVDGSGNVWYDTYNDSTLREMVGAAVPVVTPLAYAVANNLLGARP